MIWSILSFQTGPEEVWGHALALLTALKKKGLFYTITYLSTEFEYFTPKLANFGLIQPDIIAYIFN